MRILTDFEQGTPEWHAIRHGKVTMSQAKALLTKPQKKTAGRWEGATRMTYVASVAAELLSKPQGDGYQSYDMLRGKELEPFAVAAYEAQTGNAVDLVGFVLADDERIGCSPDGMVGRERIIEIKSPIPEIHLKYANRAYVEKEHGQQVQGELWVPDAKVADFISFCPAVEDVPLILHTFERDEDMIVELAESAHLAADQAAAMATEMLKHECADEVRKIARDAMEYWHALTAQDDEVIL